MSFPWFRMYHEARNDAKLRSLTDAQFRVWFNLLCLAAERSEVGTIKGLTWQRMAVEAAGGNTDLLSSTCDNLKALEMISLDVDEDVTPRNAPEGVTGRYLALQGVTLTFLKFKNRNHRKPSDSKSRIRERVSKSRKKKTYVDYEKRNAHVTPCNATPPREDSDSDSDFKDPPPPPRGGGENGARALGSILGGAPPDPAEVKRVADAVDALFPQSHFGAKVGQFSLMYPPAWIFQACQVAAASGKNVGWPFIHGILKRWQAQGGPDAPSPTGRGSIGPKPAALPPSVEQVRAERAERDKDREPVETTPELLAQWKAWAEGPDASLRKIAKQCLAEHP